MVLASTSVLILEQAPKMAADSVLFPWGVTVASSLSESFLQDQ